MRCWELTRGQRRAPTVLVGVVVAALAPTMMALPAAAEPTTTSSSPSAAPRTSGVPGGRAPVPVVAPDPSDLGQQLSEVPPAEAQLLGLLQGVRSRIATLAEQLRTLSQDLTANQQALGRANQAVAASQADVAAADERVSRIAAEQAAARIEMRQRAVAAYIRQPAGELANLVVHARDPADLSDANAYYRALVDAQGRTLARVDALGRAARAAAAAAATARDLATRTRRALAEQQLVLMSLRSSFALVQQESSDQEAQQTALLSQAHAEGGDFAAAVAQQAAESLQIAALLRQIEQQSTDAGGPALAVSSGALLPPIPGARITSPFGPRLDPILDTMGFHPGVDFGATAGTPISAAGDGTVIWAGPNGGYGNCTIIDHGHHMATLYAHQSGILVKVGDQVSAGEVIGQVGSTGWSTGPHLHFEVRIDGTPVDPMGYL